MNHTFKPINLLEYFENYRNFEFPFDSMEQRGYNRQETWHDIIFIMLYLSIHHITNSIWSNCFLCSSTVVFI